MTLLRAAMAQIGIATGFHGQIELEALRLYSLPEGAPAILYGCPSLPPAYITSGHHIGSQAWPRAARRR
jgi:hypothetical protein